MYSYHLRLVLYTIGEGTRPSAGINIHPVKRIYEAPSPRSKSATSNFLQPREALITRLAVLLLHPHSFGRLGTGQALSIMDRVILRGFSEALFIA